MKLHHLSVLVLCLAFFGCVTEAPMPQPFMGILDAYKIGDGPADTSKYNVVVHYEDIVPGKYEVKVGFGYVPSEEQMRHFTKDAVGIYAVAHSEVLKKQSGDLRLTIEPTAVHAWHGKLDGKIYAILLEYPHGDERPTVKHDIFILPPQQVGK